MSFEPEDEIFVISKTIGEDFFSCPICFNLYQEPKILPCAHTFCEKCLTSLVKKKANHDCPMCNEPFDGDVKRLKSNFFLKDLMERLSEKEANAPDPRIGTKKCELCRKEDSSNICIDCQQKCCINCAKIHKNATASKEHRVFTLEEYSRAKFNNPSAVKPDTFCKEHKREQVKFYCDTCREPICSDCTVIKHPRGEHEILNLEEVLEEFRDNMTKAIGDLLRKAKEIEKKVKDAREACVKIDEHSKTETEKIKVKFEDIEKETSRERDRLIERLTKENGTRVKKLESHISELELMDGEVMGICGYLSTALQFDDVIGLLTKQDEIANLIQEQLSMDVSSDIETIPIEFKPNNDIGIYVSRAFGAITGVEPDNEIGITRDVGTSTGPFECQPDNEIGITRDVGTSTEPFEYQPNNEIGITQDVGTNTGDELNSCSSSEDVHVEWISFDLEKILIISSCILALAMIAFFAAASFTHTTRISDAIIEVTTGSSMDIVITTEYDQKLGGESTWKACLKYPNGQLACNPVTRQLDGTSTISIPGHKVGEYVISMSDIKQATAIGDESQHRKTSKMRDSVASLDQKDVDEGEFRQGYRDSMQCDQADSEYTKRCSSQLLQKDQSIEGLDNQCSTLESNDIKSDSLSDEVCMNETITQRSQKNASETMQGESTERGTTVIDSETESEGDQCSGKFHDVILQSPKSPKSGVQLAAEAYTDTTDHFVKKTNVQYALTVVLVIAIVVLAFLFFRYNIYRYDP